MEEPPGAIFMVITISCQEHGKKKFVLNAALGA